LAEDNAVNQKLVVRLLEKAGQHVTVASNGRDAVRLWEQLPFDLVLMDVQMPDMDGFEATAAIRQREQEVGGHVSIVAMTAHAMKGDRERCLAAGMDAYVGKPIQAHELFDVLEQLLPAAAMPPIGAGPRMPEVRDWSGALQKVGGDRELLHELVRVFLEEWPKWRAELSRALAAGNSAEVRRLAHTVKGALGQFDAEEAAATAEQLETMGRTAQLQGVDEVNARLDKEIELLLPTFAALVHSGVPA
jgi:CheY-like chemotaxis protein/HPt (histidine-containing phosphotransfer) domain-containing protein